jgi:hypothetical protein
MVPESLQQLPDKNKFTFKFACNSCFKLLYNYRIKVAKFFGA